MFEVVEFDIRCTMARSIDIVGGEIIPRLCLIKQVANLYFLFSLNR